MKAIVLELIKMRVIPPSYRKIRQGSYQKKTLYLYIISLFSFPITVLIPRDRAPNECTEVF